MTETQPLAVEAGFELIDISVERLFYTRAFAIRIFLAMLLFGMVGALFGWLGLLSGSSGIVLLGAFCGFVSVSILHWNGNRVKRRAAVLVAASTPIDVRTCVNEILAKENCLHSIAGLNSLLLEAGKRGKKGVIIRLCPAEHLRETKPLGVQIEPIEFDEADAAFDELSEALGDDVKRSTGNRYEATMRRRVGRNLKLSGGWIIVVIFGINIAFALLRAYRERRLNEGLFIWSGLLFLMLFGVRSTRGKLGVNTWLLVPGGLAVRSVRRWKNVVTRHLFVARKSLLCVYRMERDSWGFIVADAERCETRVATKRELDVLLRVWTSPIPPPTMEQLEALLPA